MNCEAFSRHLAAGTPLTGEAEKHLENCPACRALAEEFTDEHSTPDRQRLQNVQRLITASLKPVRPLPSDRTLTLFLVVFFLGLTAIGSIISGHSAVASFRWQQMVAYYGAILAGALVLSVAVVQQMIPGSRRRISPTAAFVWTVFLFAVAVVTSFRDYEINDFVQDGFSCFRRGILLAAVSGVALWFVIRSGFFISPLRAATLAGFFSGLAGVAVLALHCGFPDVPHILVWHLGVALVGAAIGAGVGLLGRPRSQTDITPLSDTY